MNLRFDNNARRAVSKQFASHIVGLFEGVSDFASGYGYAVPGQYFFCLVLVNFYLSVLPSRTSAPSAG